jgi:hypothetical protein
LKLSRGGYYGFFEYATAASNIVSGKKVFGPPAQKIECQTYAHKVVPKKALSKDFFCGVAAAKKSFFRSG